MRTLVALPLVLTLACSGSSDPVGPLRDDSGAGDDGDDGSSDGADGSTGTDADGDGFTVEDGDCDDDDIGVNPAREEDIFDGIDNDCDGRIDEEWSGYSVAEQVQGGTSRILLFDTIARLDGSISLPDDLVPYSLDHGLDDNYVVAVSTAFHNISGSGASFEYAPAGVAEVSADGTTTILAAFSDPTHENSDPTDDTFHWFGALVRSVATHPDGYYLALTQDALTRIDRDGTTSVLASWGADFADEETWQLHAQDMSVDLLTGEVAILGLLGGFATWSEADGFAVRRPVDVSEGLANWDGLRGVALARMGADGWRVMLGSFETGDFAIHGFDPAANDYVQQIAWSNNNVIPLGLSDDADHDELYATAKGGDFRTIWRIRYLDETVDDAYGEVDDGVTLWGITPNY